MKKIVCISSFFIIMHLLLFTLLFNYQQPIGIFDFSEITASESDDNKSLIDDTYNLYIPIKLQEILNTCHFESISLKDAIPIMYQSNNAKQINTLLLNGDTGLFQNREYINGKILIFNSEEIYFFVVYCQDDLVFSECDFSYTIYKVTSPENFAEQCNQFIEKSNNKKLISYILNNMWNEYVIIQSKPLWIIINSIIIIFSLVFIFHKTKKNKNPTNSNQQFNSV